MEDPKNIRLMCPKCSEKAFPFKGKIFHVRPGDFVKLKFTDNVVRCNEYMWVIVKSIKGDECEGILDNEPAFVKTVKLKDQVKFLLEDILDYMPSKRR